MTASPFVENIINKYADNEELKRLLITHSRMVGLKALKLAEERGLEVDRQFLYDAAMLHDIGVVMCDAPKIFCHGTLPYICHGVAGADILRKEGLDDRYSRVCERHTGSGITAEEVKREKLAIPVKDYLPQTMEEKLICYADKFYSKSAYPDREKDPERVEEGMRRLGEGPYSRFLKLRAMFEPK